MLIERASLVGKPAIDAIALMIKGSIRLQQSQLIRLGLTHSERQWLITHYRSVPFTTQFNESKEELLESYSFKSNINSYLVSIRKRTSEKEKSAFEILSIRKLPAFTLSETGLELSPIEVKDLEFRKGTKPEEEAKFMLYQQHHLLEEFLIEQDKIDYWKEATT